MTESLPPVVAIDGPAGVGKSTAARFLARRLGLPVLDTGAMYRAVALKVLESGVDPGDREAVVRTAAATDIDVRPGAGEALEVLLDGVPVGERIRTPEVSEATSRISTYPEIRRQQVELQRRIAARAGAVVEGRDIGTVVFPDTPHKFFLKAHRRVQAERRHRELVAAGKTATVEEVEREIERRDARDSGRRISPLQCDETYTVIDTSGLTPDQVVERMARQILGGR